MTKVGINTVYLKANIALTRTTRESAVFFMMEVNGNIWISDFKTLCVCPVIMVFIEIVRPHKEQKKTLNFDDFGATIISLRQQHRLF